MSYSGSAMYKGLVERAKELYREERRHKALNGWFLAKELAYRFDDNTQETDPEVRAAGELEAIVDALPLDLSDSAIFAGTQRDAFAASYALINPAFQVENFCGYCDPLEVFDYITYDDSVTPERVASLRKKMEVSPYVQELKKVYSDYDEYVSEVAFFVEQVTGHVIPDFRPALKDGVRAQIGRIDARLQEELTPKHRSNLLAMRRALACAVRLAHRYADLAEQQAKEKGADRAAELKRLAQTLRKVPEYGASSLFEAIQSYLILWEVMCLEQAPNPFALSVGNADRIFEPYRKMEGLSREEAAALFCHFLVFYNVGERSWAISQNVLVGGRDEHGKDLTNLCTYAILDAYYEMNLPQPILSVKLHENTPEEFYESLGRFLFTPGCLTPSFFNDDSVIPLKQENGVAEEDLADYAVAGCQEPLIMGKDNGNTTNSWLNLGKILELTLTGGVSAISGKSIGPQDQRSAGERLGNVRERFYENVAFFAEKMAEAANGATKALANLPVPFLSAFMGGIETAVDMRDTAEQGTKYNGSGCLIHGLSVVADSFLAIDRFMKEQPENAEMLVDALKADFKGYEAFQSYLKQAPKFGEHAPQSDREAAEIVRRVSGIVRDQKNYLGNGFRADWSSPSTHLLYGYWVGATPDGRNARDMLNYGVDPLYGEAHAGLGFRMLSLMELPFENMDGGYASHFGIDPKYFKKGTLEEKGKLFHERVIRPLFFNDQNDSMAPYYLYVNVTTPETLRLVLANPKKYAPSGVYIMRIHGTFVNFLDLSPAIQEDIIKRLDLESTAV